MTEKEKFMREALKQAKRAYEKGEIPVGAVIVKDNKIIARAYNEKEEKKDTTRHAEIIAIQKASKKLNAWRLSGCEMYVTLEPCSMCAGALIQARIKKLYIGTMDEKTGACGSVINLFRYEFNHKIEVETGVLQPKCEKIKNMEQYRSGHNEVDSKSIGRLKSATWVRIPPAPPIKKRRPKCLQIVKSK